MLKGIDIRQRIEFVSKKDESEPKTVFVLQPMSTLDKMQFSTMISEDYSKALRFYLKKSIISITNFISNDIDEAIEMLDMDVMDELTKELNKINNVSDEERKNS